MQSRVCYSLKSAHHLQVVLNFTHSLYTPNDFDSLPALDVERLSDNPFSTSHS